MSRDDLQPHPDPAREPEDLAPRYQGRPLVRPEEEVVDQGLGFDLETLFARRTMLRGLGVGVMGLGLAACGQDDTRLTAASTRRSSLAEIPDETAGPYPGDGSNGPDVLEQSGIVRRDIRSSFGDAHAVAKGVPMSIELTIENLADDGAAYAGVAVYVWHCDRAGRYSMYSEGVGSENYLRGVQVADRRGRVRFTSIFPACYTGRWPHIHFEAYPDQGSIIDADKAIATSQVALPKKVCDRVYRRPGYAASVANLKQVSLATDNVFGDDDGAEQLARVTGGVHHGYHVSLTVGVDPTTKPTGGQPPGGGDGAPSGAPSGAQSGGPGEGGPGGGGPGGPPPGGEAGTPPTGTPSG